jgi:hypothetical protein
MRLPRAILTVGAFVAAAALIVPAHAQGRRHPSSGAQQSGSKTNKADERAYRDALKSIPEKKTDPWGNMR